VSTTRQYDWIGILALASRTKGDADADTITVDAGGTTAAVSRSHASLYVDVSGDDTGRYRLIRYSQPKQDFSVYLEREHVYPDKYLGDACNLDFTLTHRPLLNGAKDFDAVMERLKAHEYQRRHPVTDLEF